MPLTLRISAGALLPKLALRLIVHFLFELQLRNIGGAGVTLKSTPRLLFPKCAACALQLRNTGSAGVSLPKLTLRLIVRFFFIVNFS